MDKKWIWIIVFVMVIVACALSSVSRLIGEFYRIDLGEKNKPWSNADFSLSELQLSDILKPAVGENIPPGLLVKIKCSALGNFVSDIFGPLTTLLLGALLFAKMDETIRINMVYMALYVILCAQCVACVLSWLFLVTAATQIGVATVEVGNSVMLQVGASVLLLVAWLIVIVFSFRRGQSNNIETQNKDDQVDEPPQSIETSPPVLDKPKKSEGKKEKHGHVDDTVAQQDVSPPTNNTEARHDEASPSEIKSTDIETSPDSAASNPEASQEPEINAGKLTLIDAPVVDPKKTKKAKKTKEKPDKKDKKGKKGKK